MEVALRDGILNTSILTTKFSLVVLCMALANPTHGEGVLEYRVKDELITGSQRLKVVVNVILEHTAPLSSSSHAIIMI